MRVRSRHQVTCLRLSLFNATRAGFPGATIATTSAVPATRLVGHPHQPWKRAHNLDLFEVRFESLAQPRRGEPPDVLGVVAQPTEVLSSPEVAQAEPRFPGDRHD